MTPTFSRRRCLLASGAALAGLSVAPFRFVHADDLPAKQPADRLSGPPLVSAKAWAIAEGDTGKLLWSSNESAPLPMASTTKIMTAWLVLQLERDRPKLLDETVTVSEAAAKTGGSSAKIETGDRFAVRDLLHGLMLPSGNDASVALAEHCGAAYRKEGDSDSPVQAFVAQMNRQAEEWELAQTRYFDPHGMGKNHTSAANLTQIAWRAMHNEKLQQLVQTRKYECEALNEKDEKRAVTWTNTNRLLEIEGFDGIKTGTTSAAGNCLVSRGRRGKDQLIIAVLGSTSADGRYVDSRNLYRWAWRERGHKDE